MYLRFTLVGGLVFRVSYNPCRLYHEQVTTGAFKGYEKLTILGGKGIARNGAIDHDVA